jgi:hypothetical protein
MIQTTGPSRGAAVRCIGKRVKRTLSGTFWTDVPIVVAFCMLSMLLISWTNLIKSLVECLYQALSLSLHATSRRQPLHLEKANACDSMMLLATRWYIYKYVYRYAPRRLYGITGGYQTVQ